jgi:CheY-like chemotaxis protein
MNADRAPAGRALRVLIVDDDADTARSLALLTRHVGHESVVALNGPMAVQEALRQPPDVVLLDLAMPGMDGFKVAKQIREQIAAQQPVLIAISGYAGPGDCIRSKAAGIDFHFRKPVNPELLRSLLDRDVIAQLARNQSV